MELMKINEEADQEFTAVGQGLEKPQRQNQQDANEGNEGMTKQQSTLWAVVPEINSLDNYDKEDFKLDDDEDMDPISRTPIYKDDPIKKEVHQINTSRMKLAKMDSTVTMSAPYDDVEDEK